MASALKCLLYGWKVCVYVRTYVPRTIAYTVYSVRHTVIYSYKLKYALCGYMHGKVKFNMCRYVEILVKFCHSPSDSLTLRLLFCQTFHFNQCIHHITTVII